MSKFLEKVLYSKNGIANYVVPVVCVGIVFSGLMLHSIYERNRFYEQELETTLAKSVAHTLEEVMRDHTFGYQQKNEMIAAFLQEFIQKREQEVDMTVRVISADPVKGLLDIEVVEHPVIMGIRQKDIAVRKTVVFEGLQNET